METKQELIDVQPKTIDHELTIQKPQALAINPDAPLMVQVMQAVASGIKIDTDTIKAMQDIVRQEKADAAELAFAASFTLAQSDIGGVVKTRKNNQTNSMYAGLDDVIEMSKTVCAKHGFSIAFNEGVTEIADHIRLCATVLHKDGHPKQYHYDVPIGGKGIKGVVNMTAIHAKATSVSYGQRYLLCMIWNIPTKDNDGNAPPAPPAPPAKIPEPNEHETEVIRLICLKLPHRDGLVPSPGKVGRLFYVSCGHNEYPNNLDEITGMCEFLMTFQDSQMYDEIK
jgi:hypothetical protein